MAASILMLLFFLFFKKQNISAPDPQENGPDVKLLRRNSQKTNSCVWGKARQRATQDPPARRLDLATFTLGENVKLSCQAPNQAAHLRRLSVGGGTPRFSFLNSEMVSKNKAETCLVNYTECLRI